MTLRQLYLLAGILWALVLAPMVLLAIVGMGAGVAWLYLFGDEPWPEAAEQALIVLGLIGGLGTAVAAVWLGYHQGRDRHAAPTTREWQRAVALSAAPVVLALLVGAGLWLRARDYEQAMTVAVTREAAFADFVGANKKLAALTLADTQDTIRASARISGSRLGAYRLTWRVIPSSSRTAIVEGSRSLQLGAADEDVSLDFSTDELRSRYQDVVLGGRGGALIEEPFLLEIILNPVLTQDEILGLPPGERFRLEKADSPLRSRQSAEFPVRFLIPG